MKAGRGPCSWVHPGFIDSQEAYYQPLASCICIGDQTDQVLSRYTPDASSPSESMYWYAIRSKGTDIVV